MREPSLIERIAYRRRQRHRPFSRSEFLAAAVYCLVAVGWWVAYDGLVLPLFWSGLAAVVALVTFQRWQRFRVDPGPPNVTTE